MPCHICPCLFIAPAVLGAALLFGAAQPAKTDPSTKPAPSAPAKPVEKQPTPDSKAGSKDDAAYVLGFKMKRIDGTEEDLSMYKGKVIVMVNTASQCGYTPQYEGLQKLYEDRKDAGLVILGFPANNFGAQEPGTNEEIKTFCTRKYSVTFPMYSKISVKGADQAPLYAYLTKDTGPGIAGDIKWNFTKFLVDKDGKVIQRFEPAVTPDSKEVTSAIEKQLK
jgi:glutathione peroxidase